MKSCNVYLSLAWVAVATTLALLVFFGVTAWLGSRGNEKVTSTTCVPPLRPDFAERDVTAVVEKLRRYLQEDRGDFEITFRLLQELARDQEELLQLLDAEELEAQLQ